MIFRTIKSAVLAALVIGAGIAQAVGNERANEAIKSLNAICLICDQAYDRDMNDANFVKQLKQHLAILQKMQANEQNGDMKHVFKTVEAPLSLLWREKNHGWGPIGCTSVYQPNENNILSVLKSTKTRPANGLTLRNDFLATLKETVSSLPNFFANLSRQQSPKKPKKVTFAKELTTVRTFNPKDAPVSKKDVGTTKTTAHKVLYGNLVTLPFRALKASFEALRGTPQKALAPFKKFGTLSTPMKISVSCGIAAILLLADSCLRG